MEKEEHVVLFRERTVLKIRNMTRLGVFLLFLSSFALSVKGYSQQAKVTLSIEQRSLVEIVQELRKVFDYQFLYKVDELERYGKRDLKVVDASVDEVMEALLSGTRLTWRMEDNVILIRALSQDDKEKVKAIKITGKVTDKQGNPLPGVTVLVKGTGMGVVTDSEGRFELMQNGTKGELVLSFVGMRTVTVHWEKGKEVKVVMEAEEKELEEVVVTGYGDVAKGNYTGAAYTVKAEEVLMAGVSTIDQMLQGVIPGVLVMNKTGLVGSTPKIRVRGTSTLLGSQEPVWVVDGVIQRDPQPFNSEENTKFSVDADDIKELAGNAISWLNPNDIESITVLKDASATAIYGSQAANGVIVITTKKAQVGRVQVSYSGDFSIGQRPRYGLYDLMNSAERMELSRDIYQERRQFESQYILLDIGYEGLLRKYMNKEISWDELNDGYKRMAQQNTDWFDILFRNSFNHAHNLGISGGSEKIQNRTSFGYNQQKGEAIGNEVQQFTVSSNTTVNLWKNITINMLVNASWRKAEGFAYGVDPFTYAYTTSRAIPCYNEDGSYYYHEKQGRRSDATGQYVYNYNILNEMDNTSSVSNTRTWSATFNLQWRIIDGLEYQGLFSYSQSSADTKTYATERSFYITEMRGYEYGSVDLNGIETERTPLPMGGLLETDLTNTTTINVRNSLVYNKLFNNRHRVTLQLGIETNSVKIGGESASRYGYLPDRGEGFATPPATYYNYGGYSETDNTSVVRGEWSVVNKKDNKLSGYGMAVYTYDERYVLNISARTDASNRFGQDKNKRFQPTWSVGLKWRATNEAFLTNSSWVNNLDIYGSYGYQGNAVSTVSPSLIATDEYQDLYKAYSLVIQSLPYPNLGWEKTKTWNFGVDASFLLGKLNFTFNYFKKKSEVLSSRNVAYENGVVNGITSGTTMSNDGYDFVINIIPVRTSSFSWQLSLNTSVTNNSVEKNSRENTLDDYLAGSCVVDGEAFSTFYSFEFDKLEDEYGQPTFKKMDIEDAQTPVDYMVKSGTFNPDFSGGLNTMFKWKNISLYALFAVQWGGHNRLPDLYQESGTSAQLPRPEQNASTKLINRWKKPGDQTNIPSLPGAGASTISLPNTPVTNGWGRDPYVMYNESDLRVASTDFIRCRQLSLSYNFGEKLLQKMGLSYLQVKASMTNPFMWVRDKKWDGLDPETGNWPTRRVSSLSLELMF